MSEVPDFPSHEKKTQDFDVILSKDIEKVSDEELREKMKIFQSALEDRDVSEVAKEELRRYRDLVVKEQARRRLKADGAI